MGASGFGDIEPGTFLNLYRIAHSELTVDKRDNSTPLSSSGARQSSDEREDVVVNFEQTWAGGHPTKTHALFNRRRVNC